ncbi:unnamed protein product [Owenia fusiformis]|uniref:Uncharacterized protein n=1 Tax=Owenia fusiformis TaxID=6347 RepID=A0A8J1TAT1_OWEFU|nr:unnamed protein product [Owenia fusiformis]
MKSHKKKSKHQYPKQNVIKVMDKTPDKNTQQLCPQNLSEQQDLFLKFGIVPKFEMKLSSESLEKLIKKKRGEIQFDCLEDAIHILEHVKENYANSDELIDEMYGNVINVAEATRILEAYLKENDLDGVMTICFAQDLPCSARMAWHGPNQRYNKPEARKYNFWIKSKENIYLRDRGIKCLANHEIGTHYTRTLNDGLQPWFCDRKKFGIKGHKSRSLVVTEEGLAILHTVLQAKTKYLFGPAVLYYTACMATKMSFKELFEHLEQYVSSPTQRWRHVMRVKRCLDDPNDLGGYGGDQCYFQGAVEILRNLEDIDFNLLMCGKISLDELPRVKRLARMDCIRIPKFMRDIEKYKRTLRHIGVLNGILERPKKSPTPMKPLSSSKSKSRSKHSSKRMKSGKKSKPKLNLELSDDGKFTEMQFVYPNRFLDSPMSLQSSLDDYSDVNEYVLPSSGQTTPSLPQVKCDSHDFVYPRSPTLQHSIGSRFQSRPLLSRPQSTPNKLLPSNIHDEPSQDSSASNINSFGLLKRL